MPLFKTHSPSRSSLTIPPTAPGSTASSRSASPGPGPMQDDTFRNVKLLEELLKAWNDHRQALAGCAKTGKRLAKAMDELGHGLDKTGVAAQTLRPTAAALEGSADVTAKWAKRVEKEYEGCNKEAGAYFSLLAKETRSHEAYLLGINKRHAAAEKAYRKASKSLSETSTTHSNLIHLQQSLSTDVQRANADHLAVLSSKQGSLLLSVAARSGSLGVGLTHFASESLKAAAVNYKDIEYFRVLAESQWTASLPDHLDDANEGKMRELMRIQKARVAMGELDVVGDAMWDNMHRPKMGRVVSESVLNKYGQSKPPMQTSQSSAFSGNSILTGSSGLSSVTSPTESSPSTGKSSWGEMSQQATRQSNTRPLPSPGKTLDPPRFTPGHAVRSRANSGSISIPTPRRSVSQIAADLEALHSGSQTSPSLDSPTLTEKGNRRVTMPPLYVQGGGPPTAPRTLPAVQPRRASVQPKSSPSGFPFPNHVGVASPTPKRPVKMSTMDLELAADRA